MDSILGQIGVVQGVEEDIFAEVLQAAQTAKSNSVHAGSSSSEPQRASLTTLAQSIIENQEIAQDENGGDLELTEEMRAIINKRKLRNKRKANVLDENFMKERYSAADCNYGDSAEPKIDVLNEHVREALTRKKHNGTSNVDASRRTCPLCFRDLESLSELQISKHVERCSRRGTSSRQNMYSFVDDDDDDNDEGDDNYDTHNVTSSSSSRASSCIKASNKASYAQITASSYSASSTARNDRRNRKEAADDHDIVVDVDDEADDTSDDLADEAIDITSDAGVKKDDWEEKDYLRRRARLSAQDKAETDTPFATKVYTQAWQNLFEYQREGCRWLFNLYREGVGGILADEMGLGKTAQVCVHFGSLGKMNVRLHREQPQPPAIPLRQAMFLIICPATVLQHWLREMHRWAPLMRTGVFHTISTTGKELGSLASTDLAKVLKSLRRAPHAEGITVVTSYETLRKHIDTLSTLEWTAICLDEGQKIRNPDTNIAVACKQLPAFHRVLLSGTPIQNSLVELWSLFDFVYPGRLGARQAFEDEFAYPIRAGAYAHASKLQYEIAIRCAGTLQRMVRPYLLRRKKDDLQAVAKLPPKTEHILFCPISATQRRLYLQAIDSDEVKAVVARKMAAFRAINLLRKLCNHPALVQSLQRPGEIQWQRSVKEQRRLNQQQQHEQKQLTSKATTHSSSQRVHGSDSDSEYETDKDDEDEEDDELAMMLTKEGSHGVRWSDSGKLLVLSKVLPIWRSEGHKVLVFCQTTSMLTLIEHMALEMQLTYLRLDGSTAMGKRDRLIHEYNSDPNIYLMLLTTKTGGVGISLTAADRVVLFDPDWNPMTDIQARERAWRLGQARPVVVYRLISKGTIEEKIYQRQIFKLLLSNRVLDDPKQKALFSKSQIQELFELAPADPPKQYLHARDSLPQEGLVNLAEEEDYTSINHTKDNQETVEEEEDDDDVEYIPYNPKAKAVVVNIDCEEDEDPQHSGGDGAREIDFEVAEVTAAKLQEEQEVHDMLLDLEVSAKKDTTKSTGNSSSNGASQHIATIVAESDQKHDRKLLRALFAGDAITSVYNHDFLEPGVNHQGNNNKNGQQQRQQREEAARIARMAERMAHRALQNLHSSAPVYNQQQATVASCTPLNGGATTHSTNGGQQDPFAYYFGVHTTTGNSSSSSSNGPVQSSASLLAMIRSREDDVQRGVQYLAAPVNASAPPRSAFHDQNNPFSNHINSYHNHSNSSSTVTVNHLPSTSSSDYVVKDEPGSLSGGLGSVGGVVGDMTIEETIRQRLIVFFQSHTPRNSNSSNSSSRDIFTSSSRSSSTSRAVPITTQRILTHFSDLGDQYAPLFKRILRSLAVLKDGQWSLKK